MAKVSNGGHSTCSLPVSGIKLRKYTLAKGLDGTHPSHLTPSLQAIPTTAGPARFPPGR